MKWYERIDWRFMGVTAVILGAPYVIYVSSADPRLIGWVLASVAAGLLFWRLIGWFHEIPTGMRVGAFLLIVTLILGAIGQYQLAGHPNIGYTAATYPLLSQRIACIAYAIYWPRWANTKVSPYVRPKA